VKLRPYSYSFQAGPVTKIGEHGRVMFVTGESPISDPVAFAVYFDDKMHVWHLSPIAYRYTDYTQVHEICLELFATRQDDIQKLLKKDDHEA
jgi:hypothetical protein